MEREQFQEEEFSPGPETWPDAILLKWWIAIRDDHVFQWLFNRHERMVRGVCHRVLRHRQDKEDAVQKTFMILMQKPESIQKGTSLESWLHGVAFRVASDLLKRRKRRNSHEVLNDETQPTQPTQSVDEIALKEFREIVAEEVRRLPEKYRTAFMLHCLEGKSKAETAAELGLKEGTVASRVRKARELLRPRLARYGIFPPLGKRKRGKRQSE